nr:hypothetical protein [Tanacetum cinerariifolium]
NLKFLNNLQPEWSQHVTIIHQTKDLHTADYTQLYDFLKYNQKENVGNLNGCNAIQNVRNQVAQNLRVQNVGNQNGLIGVPGNANYNLNGNGNLVVERAEGNTARLNGNQIRCYNCRGVGHYARNCTVRPRRRDAAYLQTKLLIAQKEEAGIQLQAEEFDLMAATADLDEIEDVNANCILMANLQGDDDEHNSEKETFLEDEVVVDQLINEVMTELHNASSVEALIDHDSASIKENLLCINKKIRWALNIEMHDLLKDSMKSINKQFNALNKLEAQRFSQLELFYQESNEELCTYIETILDSTVKIPTDLLPESVIANNLTTMVNKTSIDMIELVGIISQIAHNMDTSPTPLSVAAKGDKSAQAEPSKAVKREPQTSGSSVNINPLAMVVHSTAKPKTEEPPLKKLRVMIDVPALTPLNSMGPVTFHNVPYVQFTAQLFSSGHPGHSTTIHPAITRSPSKGKSIVTLPDESTLKTFTPLLEQGTSTPHLFVLTNFRTPGQRPLTIEEAAQIMQEEKRWGRSQGSEISEYGLATTVQMLRMHIVIVQDSDYAKQVVVE